MGQVGYKAGRFFIYKPDPKYWCVQEYTDETTLIYPQDFPTMREAKAFVAQAIWPTVGNADKTTEKFINSFLRF
jgi:hypothetical protein